MGIGEKHQGTWNRVTLSGNAGSRNYSPLSFPEPCSVRYPLERQSVAGVWSSVCGLTGDSVGGQDKSSEIANIYYVPDARHCVKLFTNIDHLFLRIFLR